MDQGAAPQGADAPQGALGLYLTRLFLPMDDVVLTADPSRENLAWLAAHLGARPLRTVSREDFFTHIRHRHGAALLDQAVFGLARAFPGFSAQTVITRRQKIVLIAGAIAILACLALRFHNTLHALLAVLSLAFVASGIFRVCLVLFASFRKPLTMTQCPVALPSYTIIVPLYREAQVLPGLVQGLTALDYPHALLDIKIVLEEDDDETIAAATSLIGSAVPFEIIVVPPGGPRTKPKAANYALAFARGDYLVVYDAEDRPEPDQLIKAVQTFRAGPRHVACLQARLNFYNAEHNWLTRGIMAQTPQERIPAAA